jgi:hypothetical protein
MNFPTLNPEEPIFYGAAEFSRDTDIALLAEPENFDRLKAAMRELRAEAIAVPPPDLAYLKRGHAVHFRCAHPDAEGIRVDVMSVMRGLPEFPALWSRRTTVEVELGERYDLMALPDLVQAKKTQRDKDWPMIRRLVEADYERTGESPSAGQVRFWLLEARTPALLKELAGRFPAVLQSLSDKRALLRSLPAALDEEMEGLLREEEDRERAEDRAYWKPLRRELEDMRRGRGAVG